MSSPFMLRLLSASICAANRSGAIIRDVLKSGQLGIIDKGGGNDPQTEADRRAQRCIFATLQQRFPGINLIGEEDIVIQDEDYKLLSYEEECADIFKEQCPRELEHVQTKDVIVWVDPLDGTKEFTEGYPEHVTVLIGVSFKGKPVSGVIHQPFYGMSGRTAWGMVGLGVRGISCVQAGATEEKLKEGIKIVVTRSRMNQTIQDAVHALNPSEILQAGGSGNKILMVLEGKADIYMYPSWGTKKWDTCAGEALLLAAGGKLTNTLGHNLIYDGELNNINNSSGILVTMRGHDEVVSRIPMHVKSKF